MYRPTSLAEYTGAAGVKTLAETVAITARTDLMATPHVLLTGLPGTGKTTLARIIANESRLPLAEFIGEAVEYPDILAKIDHIGSPGCIVFLDEIHSANPKLLERLYVLMEDNQVIRDNTPSRCDGKVVVIGATTEKQELAGPLVDRFGVRIEVPPYTEDGIAEILLRAIASDCAKNPPDTNLALLEIYSTIAKRCKNIPRRAISTIGLLSTFLNTHRVKNAEQLSLLLPYFGVYINGLDDVDLRILNLLDKASQPVGLSMMSLCINEDPKYIAKSYEPYLFAKGYARKSVCGRSITEQGRAILREIAEEKKQAEMLAYVSKTMEVPTWE